MVHTMLAGADCTDHAEVLRCGATSRVLGHRAMAPSTVGTFLRAFTFGTPGQLDRSPSNSPRARGGRGWPGWWADDHGPGLHRLPGARPYQQGAADGDPHALGRHPLLPAAPGAAGCSGARRRTGRANTARGTARLVDELAARVRRAGASGELTLRAGSGFLSAKAIRACRRTRSAAASPSG